MKKEDKREADVGKEKETEEALADMVEEIEVEDLTVDGICGVY